MMRLRATLLTVLFSFLVLTPVLPAFAQQQTSQEPSCKQRVADQVKAGERHFITNPDCICEGNCGLEDFVGVTVEVSRYLFGITGSLALFMFMVGAFWWLTAAGDAGRIEKGRNTLVQATIGIAIVFGAWALVNTILAGLTGNLKGGTAQILSGDWYKVIDYEDSRTFAGPPRPPSP